jgi:tetratricopeptide (TPR) repeat protein
MRWRWFGLAIGLAVAGLMVIVSPAHAQATLSEQLSRTISEGQKAELQRQFGRALVNHGAGLDLASADTVSEAQEILAKRATLFEAMQDFRRAEADFTTAVKLEPADPKVYADRGYFYMRQNRYGDALGDFLTASRIAPDNARFRFATGRVQAALSNYSGAISSYDEAIKLNPQDPRLYLARAEAEVHLGLLGQAHADYTKAIDSGLTRRSDRYFAYLGRGYVELRQGDYARAIPDFDQVLDIDPDSGTALLWRAYAKEKSGQTELALQDYERAAAADPKDPWARRNLQRLRSN